MKTNTKKLPSYIKLNSKIRPQDDFYSYVCHHWSSDNPLPTGKNQWTIFDQVKGQVDKQIKDIVSKWLETSASLSEDQKQLVDFYQSLENNQKHLKTNITDFKKLIAQVELTATGKNSQLSLLALAHYLNLELFFKFRINLDFAIDNYYCLEIQACQLSLESNIYLEHNRSKQLDYLSFITRRQQALNKLGIKYDLQPEKILEIETKLNQFKLDQATDKSDKDIYSLKELNNELDFNWNYYLKLLRLGFIESIIVSNASYMKSVIDYLNNLPVDDLKQFLLFKLSLKYGQFLNDDIFKIDHIFFNKHLKNQDFKQAKYEAIIDLISHYFAETINQTYLKLHFNLNQQKDCREIVKNLMQSFYRRLNRNQWMSDETKLYGQAKLKQITINLGYTSNWLNYRALELSDFRLVDNLAQIERRRLKSYFKLLREPIDRRHDNFNIDRTQTVDARANLRLLKTTYTSSLLQPPFYDSKATWAYNLGAIGSVIAHELTHHFDNRGCKIDIEGNLDTWLSSKEQRAFHRLANKLVRLANKHYITPEIKMSGKQVIDEMIADLGGLEIVLDAIKAKIKQPQALKLALKQALIGYAFHFATNADLETKITQAQTSVHPDPVFRVNGIVVHCNDFYEVFEIQPTDNLYLKPQHRLQIW